MRQTNSYLHSLAIEYLQLVGETGSGLYSSEVVDHLNSERSVLHEQLLEALGETRESDMDMVAVCHSLVNLAYVW